MKKRVRVTLFSGTFFSSEDLALVHGALDLLGKLQNDVEYFDVNFGVKNRINMYYL